MPHPSSHQLLKRERLLAAAAAGQSGPLSSGTSIRAVSATPFETPPGGRRSLLLRLSTEDGAEGIAEMAAVGGMRAALAEVDRLKEVLVGKDAGARVFLHTALGREEKPASPAFLSALNVALLDLAGKQAGCPAYAILSGRTRNRVRALTRLEGATEKDLLAGMERAREAGHRAFLIPLLLPEEGIRGRQFYRQVRSRLDRLRREAGEGVDFALDCGGRLLPAQAAALAREVESFRPLWLDEPCNQTTDTVRRRIADESVTPVGLGRSAVSLEDFQAWLKTGCLDVARPDVLSLGIDGSRKLAAHAETHYVAVAPVCAGGPVASAAGLHLAASIPNFVFLEIPFPVDSGDRSGRSGLVAPEVESVKDGFLSLPAGPGLGLSLDEAYLQRHRINL